MIIVFSWFLINGRNENKKIKSAYIKTQYKRKTHKEKLICCLLLAVIAKAKIYYYTNKGKKNNL